MKTRLWRFYYFITIFNLLYCCHTDTSQQQKVATTPVDSAPQDTTTAVAIRFDRTFDYSSRIIAGLPATETEPYASLTRSAAWQRYAAAMDSSWTRAEKQRFGKMRNWATHQLSREGTANTVFYPFSGPDFIHAYTFFPEADHYYLFGLEPIGDLPDLRDKPVTETIRYCEAVRTALRDIFQRSYFQTKRMLTDLPQINGVVPLICVFLVRTGNVVTNVQPLLLLDNGQTMNWKGARTQSPKKLPRVVRIDFLDAASRKPKSLFYYSGDLSDAGIKARPALQQYLNQLPDDCAGYVKSASYLMHYGAFSTIRNAMLNKCKTLLQDDTGIAYQYFDPQQWQIRLYGSYLPPIAEFKNRFQKDLNTAYLDSTQVVQPLPFDLGYHWGDDKDNLLLAVKK